MNVVYQWQLKNLSLQIRTSEVLKGWEARRIRWYQSRGWSLITREELTTTVRLTFRKQTAD